MQFIEKDKKEKGLYASSKEELSIVDETNILSDYISRQADFLDIKEPKKEIIIDKLKFLQVRFKNVDIVNSNIKLWSEVYSNNLYELNWEMIANILEYGYKKEKCYDYNKQNLTLILSRPQEPLALYVKENMNVYFEVLLANCNGEISDNEDVVIYVLNDNSLNEEHKMNYIKALTTMVTSLNNIDNSLWWTRLIELNLLLYSGENVLRYFIGNGAKYNDTLIQFINKLATNFSVNNNANEEFDEKSISIFFYFAFDESIL